MMIKVSDYVFNYLAEIGVRHVFSMSGGVNMHLTDSMGRNPHIKVICPLHEQAGAMAAEGYARITNDIGVCLVTCGPSGTNTVTGVAGAWVDSIPSLFISGQVNLQDTIGNSKLRQLGIQEVDIINIIKPITKYAVMITDPYAISYHLQKAVYLARHSRPGPVWIDIPLNLQGARIDENKLIPFNESEMNEETKKTHLQEKVTEAIRLLGEHKRPVLLVGNGVRLAGALEEFSYLLEKVQVPVLTTWGAADLLEENHPLYIGRPGLFGQRAANFALQNSDLLICLGSRLSIPITGYNYRAFARAAKVVMVDIDMTELEKKRLHVELPVHADVKDFLTELNNRLSEVRLKIDVSWLKRCKQWKQKYPVILKEYFEMQSPVNSFVFIDTLSDELSNDDIIVTDMGTSFTCAFQTFKVKKGQRFFTSGGLASMGFGLPGSIGACFASGKKRTICLSGDGGLQMNIQELQTVIYHNLPIKLFVINNGGYLAIKNHQTTNFNGFYVGADKSSGVSFPDTIKVAEAYGFRTVKITHLDNLREQIRETLDTPGPVVCEVVMSPDQLLVPRLTSKLKNDGTMEQAPLEDMFPFLERGEFSQNMLIAPFER